LFFVKNSVVYVEFDAMVASTVFTKLGVDFTNVLRAAFKRIFILKALK